MCERHLNATPKKCSIPRRLRCSSMVNQARRVLQSYQAMKKFVEEENPGSPAALTLSMAVKRNGLKDKWLRAQAAVVIGFVLQAGLAAAQNLVTNPGFETGDTTGWFAFGTPTLSVETSQVHSGTYACLVTNRTATYMGIAQSFVGVLSAGQTYDVSAWLRLVNGGNQTMHLTMQKTDGSGTSYAQIASGSVSSSGWTQLSGQYTYNPSGTVSALNFYAEVTSSSNASYYIDDANFSGQPIVTNPPINGVSTVDWNNVHQRIDGFGASSAYNGSWTTNQADILFSTNLNVVYSDNSNNKYTNNGIGLSLLRNHIVPANDTSASSTPTTVETSIMQMGTRPRCPAFGARPGRRPRDLKSTNDIYDSGVANCQWNKWRQFPGRRRHQSGLRQPARQLCGQHENYLRHQSLRHFHPKRARCEC